MFPTSAVFIMLTNAAIPTFFTVLFVIQGTFSQNELFYHSEQYCRRFIPPTITSALGLCTYPCLLLSNDQPPKILVFSEPDGTACKVGNCQAGFCQRTHDYGAAKRMKRDVSTSVSSSQSNSSTSQKQLSSRRGSEKPKSSKRDRIEQRRRQMWTRCDCASMRGLFIDISYSVSGLRLGRRGKRGRRRKVGCRVICFFLINKYKHDPKWASLFEARFTTAGSGKLANATGATTNGISAAGSNPVSNIVRGNVSGSFGSAGTGLTNNRTSGPPAAGPLNVAAVNKAGGGVGGGSNTSAGTGSMPVHSASTSINGGTLTIPPITSNTVRGEASNITSGGTFSNNPGAGYPINGGANIGTSTAPVESTLPARIQGTAETSGKPAATATTSGVVANGESSGGNPQNAGSRNGAIVNAQASAAGGGGVSTGGASVSGNPKNESGGGLSSISAGGASTGTTTAAAVGRESGTHGQNVVVSSTGPSQITATSTASTNSGNSAGRQSGNNGGNALQNSGLSGSSARSSNSTSASSNEQGTPGSGIGSVGSGLGEEAGTGSLGNNGSGSVVNGTNAPIKPKVESATGPSTMTSGGTVSGGSIPVGNETVGSGVFGASAGGILRQPGAGSPTSTVASAPENGGGLSTAISSSLSRVGISSAGSGTNIDSTNAHIDVTRNTGTTGTGGNLSIPGIGPNRSSSSRVSGVNGSLSSGGGSLSGEGTANGLSSNVGVVSGAAPESSVSPAHPRGQIIRPSPSSDGAGVGTGPEGTGIPVTGGELSATSTAPTIVNPAVTAGGGETSAGVIGTAPTASGGARYTSTGGATTIISTEQPNENPNNLPEATSAGGRIGMGIGAGFGNSAPYGAGASLGNNVPFNFGGPYVRGASGFGSTGSEVSSGPWGPPGGAFNRISAGYRNAGRFGNMPGPQPFGYASNGRFSGDVGLYEDDIFFQD